MSQEKKVVAGVKLSLSEEKNLGFIESIGKTNTEKITREILEGLSEDTPIKNCLIAMILIKLLQTLLIIRYGLPTDGWA